MMGGRSGSKPRILQVYRDYFSRRPGGIERHVHDLAHGLAGQFQMEVLATSGTRRGSVEKDADVTVHLVPEFARIKGAPISPAFVKVMRQGRYDLIHLHIPTPLGQLAYALSGSRAARIATYHADHHRYPLLGTMYTRFLKRALPRYGQVIASSPRFVRTSEVLSHLQEQNPSSLRIVPYGVDTERFAPGPTDASRSFREAWGTPVVLFVGRLADYKGLSYLIDAMRGVDATLVIVGDGKERPLVSAAANRSLGPPVIHLPFVPDSDLPDIYRAADVFCLPSTSSAETFGLATLEAMACRIPVITTEVGTATSEINVDGETGYVIPPRDSHLLRGAISEILTGDSGRPMGRAARARVEHHYGLDLMLYETGQAYGEALARS